MCIRDRSTSRLSSCSEIEVVSRVGCDPHGAGHHALSTQKRNRHGRTVPLAPRPPRPLTER
eukprot:5414618-Prymnesium_polylepis.1